MHAEICKMTAFRSYRVILEPEEDGGGFHVIVPTLPHVHTHGDTVEEAMAMAREAVSLELSYLSNKGLDIPSAHDSMISLPLFERVPQHRRHEAKPHVTPVADD